MIIAKAKAKTLSSAPNSNLRDTLSVVESTAHQSRDIKKPAYRRKVASKIRSNLTLKHQVIPRKLLEYSAAKAPTKTSLICRLS